MINELNTGSFDIDDNKVYDFMANKIGGKLKFNVVKTLGNGLYGKAYLLNNNKVLKITTNSSEATTAFKLLNFENPRTSTIYNVFKLKYKGIPDEKSLYAIILEYLEPVNFNQKGSVPINFIEKFVLKGYSFETVEELLFTGYKYTEPVTKMIKEVYDLFVELNKVDLLHGDVHWGNIGYKNNQLAIYDITVFQLNKSKINNTLKIR